VLLERYDQLRSITTIVQWRKIQSLLHSQLKVSEEIKERMKEAIDETFSSRPDVAKNMLMYRYARLDKARELAKLEEEQRNIEQVQIAVDKATELEEWILDNLKRLKPIEAWKNSRQLIDLLQDLHEYLNKGDLLKKTYTGIIQELLAADALLKEATTLDFPEEKGSYADVKSRMTTLAAVKLELASHNLAKINSQLEVISEEIIKEIKKVEDAETTGQPDIAGDPLSEGEQGGAKTNKIALLFKKISLAICLSMISIMAFAGGFADTFTFGRLFGPFTVGVDFQLVTSLSILSRTSQDIFMLQKSGPHIEQ